LILKVMSFGSFFASLDFRQDSSILRKAHLFLREKLYSSELATPDYENISEEEKIRHLQFESRLLELTDQSDPLVTDTFETIRYIKQMQDAGGELAAHRFIISNCQQASDILQLIELFLASGWSL